MRGGAPTRTPVATTRSGTRSGTGIATRSGTGIATRSGTRSGTGIATRSGTGIATRSGTGIATRSGTRSGTGIATRSGTGITTRSGTGITTRSGTGITTRSGTGTTTRSGTGTTTRSGTGTTTRSGTPAPAATPSEFTIRFDKSTTTSNTAITASLVQTVLKTLVTPPQTVTVTLAQGGGGEIVMGGAATRSGTRSGTGIATRSGTRSGTGIATRSGTGIATRSGTRSGTGIATRSGTGIATRSGTRSGTGIATRSGTGIATRSGTGITTRSGTGIATRSGTPTGTRSGTGTSTRSGTGTTAPPNAGVTYNVVFPITVTEPQIRSKLAAATFGSYTITPGLAAVQPAAQPAAQPDPNVAPVTYPDGSRTVTNVDGSTTTTNPDGTVTIRDKNGNLLSGPDKRPTGAPVPAGTGTPTVVPNGTGTPAPVGTTRTATATPLTPPANPGTGPDLTAAYSWIKGADGYTVPTVVSATPVLLDDTRTYRGIRTNLDAIQQQDVQISGQIAYVVLHINGNVWGYTANSSGGDPIIPYNDILTKINNHKASGVLTINSNFTAADLANEQQQNNRLLVSLTQPAYDALAGEQVMLQNRIKDPSTPPASLANLKALFASNEKRLSSLQAAMAGGRRTRKMKRRKHARR